MAANGLRAQPRRGWLFLAGLLPSIAVVWTLSGSDSEIDQQRRHFAYLQREVESARQGKDARVRERGRLLRLQAQARATTGAEHDTYTAQATALASGLEWGDRATVRAAVLATPLVSVRRAPGPDSVATATAADTVTPASSGCVSCHVTIATRGFESYPSPFRTHPRIETYLDAASAHPASRFDCRQCHDGDPKAETFAAAGHSKMELTAATSDRRAWVTASTPGAMLPLARTEASCVSCHQGEWYLPGADALNAAYVAYDRGGCYACHSFPGYERGRKRGPDLRRIGSKVSADWMRRWLRSPRSVKPATWMPEFWQPSDFDGDGRGAVEVEAVVAYLMASSERYQPVARQGDGDPSKGKALVESVGCLGCHITEASPRPAAGLRRTFGPPLQSLRGKLTQDWSYDWVSAPDRYSPGTKMPALRLTSEEATDVSAYLATLDGPSASPSPASSFDDAAFRAVAQTHAQAAVDVSGRLLANPESLSGDALRVETGRRVVAALGCYQCHSIAGFEYQQPTQYAFRRGAPVFDDEIATGLHLASRQIRANADPRDRATWRRAPQFTLQPDEVSALALAVTAFPRGRALSDASIERAAGRVLVHSRNCVGCHAIEGTGGDFLKLVSEPSLGPPLLTPEGSRVQPDWLRAFIRDPRTIRPWLSVRMPHFGLSEDELTQAVAYLRAIAPRNPTPTPAPAGVTAEVGKELFDLLKCVSSAMCWAACRPTSRRPISLPTSGLRTSACSRSGFRRGCATRTPSCPGRGCPRSGPTIRSRSTNR
ncbi:MAG: c-type cytochrome [Vicinamibacterales bacterium]